ncbi:hypothetical protein [Methylobacter psychrophilus]|uniref:hypothetical protein n=1 Tax=Methylobacter psychrophilus TaxID=96941 RepID=UPI0021D51AA9|nr:hypothetical protein [Methylobacter psychrophilus]
MLEILKNLPKNKIKIQETDSDNRLDFEQEMDYTLKKNQELYKKVCHDTAVNTGVNPVIA